MYVTKPNEFIGFGAMDVTKPYEFIGSRIDAGPFLIGPQATAMLNEGPSGAG
jgi:hypothetical protein